MDIKWRKYSHSLAAKVIAFAIVILCFTSSITIFTNNVALHKDLKIAFEDNYYLGNDYINISSDVVNSLRKIIKYKSEDSILSGKTLENDEIADQEDQLFREFEDYSNSYNPRLPSEENYARFKEVEADKISEIREQLIKRDLHEYDLALGDLAKYQGLIYYTRNGETEFSNSTNKSQEYFQSFPAYMIFEGSKIDIFPKEVSENAKYFLIESSAYELNQQDIIYIAFTKEYLNQRIAQWKEDKLSVTNNLYQVTAFLSILVIAFIYLVLVIGRKPQPEIEQGVHLNPIDRIYNDLNIGMGLLLIASWAGSMVELHHSNILLPALIFPITLLMAAVGLLLVLSLIKHLKNRTIITHTLIYIIWNKLYKFIKDIYNSGTVGVKIGLIMIGYPIIIAMTFFMFPVTIGAAAWMAQKKVKEFKAIKEGVRQVKEGDIHHKVDVPGNGEFAKLAADINTITDGLHKAVENELKSERLKTELITNVSHDIRTPLTSIITYVDLLKNERDQVKIGEYLEIIDQKSQRLKVLTEDLFEAAKASSGNIPVDFERIDILSLITQGLGELDDKIKERKLEFKISHPDNRVYIKADGKLLWRSIENLISNIFKYALEGSRVYIDIIETGAGVMLTIKNISAYELNISSDELMERFKRGDESRGSQGSGLGLSIAKSLIEIQNGIFNIEIDGDLFKAMIQISKADAI